MTLPLLNASPLIEANQLADAGDLSALKRAAAKQFESLFVGMVLKSMQQANFKDPLFGSDQGSLYQDMYDDQVAAEISKGKGLGLADMLVQQLRREQPGATAAAATASKAGSGATPDATAASRTATNGAAAAGRVAPAAASGCPTSAQQASFARALWPDAQQAARQLGVSPVTLLAQAALETDWGRSVPQDAGGGTSNNLFGIKATAAWDGPAVESSTQEYSGGVATTVKAQFRSYGSPGQCFQDYVALLRGNPRYASALGTGSDVQAFGSALQQGGYATDPDYAGKLTAVAGTLARALGPQGASGPLKFAASPPNTSGSGTLQRR